MNATRHIPPGGIDRRQWNAEKKASKNSDRVKHTSSTPAEPGATQARLPEHVLNEAALDAKPTPRQVAQSIKDAYPGVNFKFVVSPERFSVKSLAAAAGDGMNFIVSQDFLTRMTADTAAQAEGEAWIQHVIDQLCALPEELPMQDPTSAELGAVIHNSGQASVWAAVSKQPTPPGSVSEILSAGVTSSGYQEKGGRSVTEIRSPDGVIKLVFIKRLRYNAGKHLSRLAEIKSVGEVRTFIGGIQSYMNQVRSDRSWDESEVRAAIAQMKNVILRAGRKIKHIEKEEMMKKRFNQAAKQQHVNRAREIARELGRKKTARKSKEYARAGTADEPPREDLTAAGQITLQCAEQKIASGTASLDASADAAVGKVEADIQTLDVQV